MSIEIQPKCTRCPVLCDFNMQSEAIERIQRSMSLSAMDMSEADVRQQLIQMGVPHSDIDQMIERGRGIITSTRDMMLDSLEDGDRIATGLAQQAEVLQGDCLGPLRMRATTKAGRRVLVTVCASNAVPTGKSQEASHVERG